MMEWQLYRGTDGPHKLIFGLIRYNPYQWRTEGFGVSKASRIPEDPPKSCQTESDFENCQILFYYDVKTARFSGKRQ